MPVDPEDADPPASLIELAHRYGVATGYADWTGRPVTVAAATLTAVLDALGVPAATRGSPLTTAATGSVLCLR